MPQRTGAAPDVSRAIDERELFETEGQGLYVLCRHLNLEEDPEDSLYKLRCYHLSQGTLVVRKSSGNDFALTCNGSTVIIEPDGKIYAGTSFHDVGHEVFDQLDIGERLVLLGIIERWITAAKASEDSASARPVQTTQEKTRVLLRGVLSELGPSL